MKLACLLCKNNPTAYLMLYKKHRKITDTLVTVYVLPMKSFSVILLYLLCLVGDQMKEEIKHRCDAAFSSIGEEATVDCSVSTLVENESYLPDKSERKGFGRRHTSHSQEGTQR